MELSLAEQGHAGDLPYAWRRAPLPADNPFEVDGQYPFIALRNFVGGHIETLP